MNPNPESKPTASEAPKAAAPETARTATQVAPPTAAPQPSQPVIAEPPKDIEFTEVPEGPAAPVTPGTVTQPVVVAGAQPKNKKSGKPGPKGPAKIIVWAVIVFALLAGLAYYAYTKSV